MASRTDVVIDFSQFSVGQSVYLKRTRRPRTFGSGPRRRPDPAPGLPIGTVLMRFDVVSERHDPRYAGDSGTLTDLPPIRCGEESTRSSGASGSARSTRWEQFPISHSYGRTRTHQASSLSTRTCRSTRRSIQASDHVVLKGTTEEWVIRNDTLPGNWLHPVHIHLEEGRILERTSCSTPAQPDA